MLGRLPSNRRYVIARSGGGHGRLLVTSVSAAQSVAAIPGPVAASVVPAAFATPADFDGGFQFCRIVFRTDRTATATAGTSTGREPTRISRSARRS